MTEKLDPLDDYEAFRERDELRCDQCDRLIDKEAVYADDRLLCWPCWDQSPEAIADRAARRAFEASWAGSR